MVYINMKKVKKSVDGLDPGWCKKEREKAQIGGGTKPCI